MNGPILLFQFNIYSGLLLPFVVQGVIMSVLFFRRSITLKQKADTILAVLLLLYTFRVAYWMMGFAGWYDVRDWHTTFMFYFPFNHWLAVGPLIYFYFLHVTNASFKFQRHHWWHFLPAGLFLLRYLVFFAVDVVLNHWYMEEPLPVFYATKGELLSEGLGFLDQFWTYLETISLIIYLVLTLRLFRRYRIYIVDNFSDTERIDFSWLRNFLIANLIGTVIWIGFNIANLILTEPLSYIQDWYSFFFLGVILYYLSIEGYRAGYDSLVSADLQFDASATKDEEILETPQIDKQLTDIHEAVKVLLAEEKLYRESDLNLKKLARKLGCSSTLLSKAINTISEVNFNDFINRYRINEFKVKVADPAMKHFSLLAIAHDCGFNSKATFNRAFKKWVGQSPSAFVKSID